MPKENMRKAAEKAPAMKKPAPKEKAQDKKEGVLSVAQGNPNKPEAYAKARADKVNKHGKPTK